MINENEPAAIKKKLKELADEKYRSFSSALLPGTDNILGVRLPLLRRLSREIVKSHWQDYLGTAEDEFFEEIMLQGFVIGIAPCHTAERIEYITNFVPKIDNWSVCDSFCVSLKFAKEQPGKVWTIIDTYLKSDREFDLRFALVMILFYFIDKSHIHEIFRILNELSHDGYYVKMAAAWLLSQCFVSFPHETMAYLKNNRLDSFIYNKALQKITESLKVDSDTKKLIRSMRRK